MIEVDLAVGPERGFHGVVWRFEDEENFESFFVRPHQTGNPDAIQYTPVCNDISSWQLYHGPGYWAPIAFPLDEWFRLRVVFAGTRADVFVGDLERPALEISELKRQPTAGKVGVFVSGAPVHVAGFAYDERTTALPEAEPAEPLEGIVPAWSISDPFPEAEIASSFGGRSWTQLSCEPSGLADLSKINGIRDGKNTVLARTVIRSDSYQTKVLEFGFSDRAAAFLNGRELYRGDDSYRTRDYRFLGSIGYFDALVLPLVEGENELVFAVSEDFGGWGVQARFPDPSGLKL